MEAHKNLRQLEKGWDYWKIVAAIVVSFLGTFTSTQLMIQARLTARFSSALTWIITISLTFGFCAVWSLHFIGMLACRLDLPIGLDVGLTLLTGILAVTFTFIAIGFELLWERYYGNTNSGGPHQNPGASSSEPANMIAEEASMPLLGHDLMDNGMDTEWIDPAVPGHSAPKAGQMPQNHLGRSTDHSSERGLNLPSPLQDVNNALESSRLSISAYETTSDSRISSSQRGSNLGMAYDLKSMAFQGSAPTKNAFIAIYEGIYAGMCWKAVMMGLVWSLSVTSIHYGGLAAMKIPGGFLTLNPALVIVSVMISWVVCIVGYIYMVHIEPHLSQQLLFSIVAALGIAGMHFTGKWMWATTFWSTSPPADAGGYPPELPVAVGLIAILACTLANGLLAHNATVSRNKLAEIVWTRRKLWRAIAQKETAEAAAAARSKFIALASHEIRTPLHHIQGYGDLLSKTDLNEESRQLLSSIQSATKTLSLITNNVLDWSKLESDRDALSRPISLNVRSVFESIIVLLPSTDDEVEIEIMAVIAPDVPKFLFLDETYIHRILMNLLSNSLKFTRSGYVMLSVEMIDEILVAKVQDSGTGIPPSFIPQLFEPFSQAHTRGSQRGTGLGLSIVKQLLEKMDGSISVESRHGEQGFPPDKTGSIFTIKVPVQIVPSAPPSPKIGIEVGKVALVHQGKERGLEGLTMAWKLFGYEVTVVKDVTKLSDLQINYVWVDSEFLQCHPEFLHQLVNQEQWTVLVPFDSQETLQRLPGLLSAPHFVPLRKPLIWHTFNSRLAIPGHASSLASSRSVRFASEYSAGVLGPISSDRGSISKNSSILLVEDNPINQRLGSKMLSSLGYSVLLANDGDEAISQTLKHDTVIDVILMDQSMPIKDGVTATREIRVLESTGKLSRRHLIIATTAVVDIESRAQFRDAGADDFLAKPMSLDMLQQTLAAFSHAI